jgi:hypothetical protein
VRLEFLLTIFIFTAFSSVLGYLSFAARKARPAVDAQTGSSTFMYPAHARVIVILCVVFTAVMGFVLGKITTSESSEFGAVVTVIGIFLFLASTSVITFLEFFLVRVIVSPESLISISPWTGRREFRWEEIKRVSCSQINSWYVITGPGATKIRASSYMRGFDEFKNELRTRVSRERWFDAQSEYVSIGGSRV